MKTIVLSLPQKQNEMKALIEKLGEYKVVCVASTQESTVKALKTYKPDILFYVKGVSGPFDEFQLLVKAKNVYKATRIIFIYGGIPSGSKQLVENFRQLVNAGVYDICTDKILKASMINKLLMEPAGIEKGQLLLNKLDQKPAEQKKDYLHDTTQYEGFGEGYPNVITFSSIKPGTGKSFVSTNIAAAIAQYGRKNKEGKSPKVAIIEGDLQTLSVGTLLKIEDKSRNLKSALDAVASVINEQGEMIGTSEQQRNVHKTIMDCFLPFREIGNLYGLVGSQLYFRDMVSINPHQYFYLISSIINDFDVIIIDSNSSLEHTTTGPILQLSSTCYYVLDLDYNNVRINLRYRDTLNKLNLLGKVRYVLNKHITDDLEKRFYEPLEYNARQLEGAGFNIAGKIPAIDVTVVFNRAHEGTPIILDRTPETLLAREEITKLANTIWPMNNFVELTQEREKYKSCAKEIKEKPKKKRFFRR